MLRFSGLLGMDTPITIFFFHVVRYPSAGKLHSDHDDKDTACICKIRLHAVTVSCFSSVFP